MGVPRPDPLSLDRVQARHRCICVCNRQHGLSSSQMTLITSDCCKTRSRAPKRPETPRTPRAPFRWHQSDSGDILSSHSYPNPNAPNCSASVRPGLQLQSLWRIPTAAVRPPCERHGLQLHSLWRMPAAVGSHRAGCWRGWRTDPRRPTAGGTPSRRRGCHSAAPTSPFSR